jgi:NhaP-type Na+/H+ or K+/H+ antiporter
MEGSFELTLQMVMAVLAGISAQVIAEYLKVPSIVFLLMFGILLGRDGFGLLQPQQLGVGLEVIVALSVAVILFEGGLNLELRELGKVSGSLRNMVTLGTLITLLGGGMAAHWLGEFPWSIAFLYASLVVVTGPTVISPLLKQVQVDRQVATLLEGEGVLIDPVGAILAVVVLNTILNGDAGPSEVIIGLTLRLGIGGFIGAAGGWLLGVFLKRANFISEDLKNLVVLAGMWGLFGLAQIIRSESGLMATVVAGIVLGASALPEERLLRRFKGQLTVLGVSVLFILLSADLSIASIFALGWGSLYTVFALMFVVRPISIFLCTWNSGLNWRQKLFLSWVAPKGIVSASVASLFAILLTQRGINGGDSIKALVFLTIILTVFLQGLTARWVANLLQINRQSGATGAVIIGCNPLSRLIARLFQERGESVVLIDTDPGSLPKSRARKSTGVPKQWFGY